MSYLSFSQFCDIKALTDSKLQEKLLHAHTRPHENTHTYTRVWFRESKISNSWVPKCWHNLQTKLVLLSGHRGFLHASVALFSGFYYTGLRHGSRHNFRADLEGAITPQPLGGALIGSQPIVKAKKVCLYVALTLLGFLRKEKGRGNRWYPRLG